MWRIGEGAVQHTSLGQTAGQTVITSRSSAQTSSRYDVGHCLHEATALGTDYIEL